MSNSVPKIILTQSSDLVFQYTFEKKFVQLSTPRFEFFGNIMTVRMKTNFRCCFSSCQHVRVQKEKTKTTLGYYVLRRIKRILRKSLLKLKILRKERPYSMTVIQKICVPELNFQLEWIEHFVDIQEKKSKS